MAAPGYIGRYINLDRSPERRRDIEASLGRLGLTDRYERFVGIDGRDEPAREDVANPAELGCYLSHLGVLTDAVGTDRWLHVLEDDAEISRSASRVIDVITASPDIAKYDLVFTNIGPWLDVAFLARWRALFDDNVSVSGTGEVTSVNKVTLDSLAKIDFTLCTSYLVNPRSAAKIADVLQRRLDRRPFEPIDFALSNLSRSGQLSIACTMPFLTKPRWGVNSTIGNPVRPSSAGHLLIEAALYADRNVAEIRRAAEELDSTTPSTITADLITSGFRHRIRV